MPYKLWGENHARKNLMTEGSSLVIQSLLCRFRAGKVCVSILCEYLNRRAARRFLDFDSETAHEKVKLNKSLE